MRWQMHPISSRSQTNIHTVINQQLPLKPAPQPLRPHQQLPRIEILRPQLDHIRLRQPRQISSTDAMPDHRIRNVLVGKRSVHSL